LRIGQYEIISELGRGGMGVVYKAFDPKLEREVAIKVIENLGESTDNLTQSSHQELLERFKTEAKAIAKLNHPNIVSIYDFGTENDKNYMVMEFLKGRDLSHILKFNSPLPIELVVKTIISVCQALDFAHQNGIIHRDIKPANIILLDNGNVKLMDFGIARIQESQSQLTQAGTILGSILYISPEQLINAKKVDKRADIYSLGVSMYELLTGKFPYDGDNVASIVSKILQSTPELPSKYNPNIPKDLEQIIIKAIEKDPDQRYQRAIDLADDLNNFLFKLKGGTLTSSTSTVTSNNVSSKTFFNKSVEYSLVDGLDNLNLYSLVYRIIQTWKVENIGNKPLLEVLYKNESLSQAIVVSDRIILLSYNGLLIGAVSNNPDKISTEAYEVTAEITKVDIKSCIPSESEKEILVILSSILGNGLLIAKHPSLSNNDLENILEKVNNEKLSGHIEIIHKEFIKYKGFIDGKEIFTLSMPNKNSNIKGNRMDVEIYEAELKLIGPSLRRALIDSTIEIISKSHGSGNTLKQLSLMKENKIIPEILEEAVRNTDILVVLGDNEKILTLGSKNIKYSDIIRNLPQSMLIYWLIKDILIKITRAKFNNIKNSFSWIWNLRTIKLAQNLKLLDGKSVNFDIVGYDNSEKIIMLSRYSNKGNILELQNLIEDANNLKKSINNNLKAVLYISGSEIYHEILRYYEKITKRESFLAFNSPKAFISSGQFFLFLIKDTIDGFKLIQPIIN
jgi:serine/threonine protein kinase